MSHGPDRYEGPLPAELADMTHDGIAVALLDVVHAIDAHWDADTYWRLEDRMPAHPEALYLRRRWLTEAARRIRG